ncbi:hypothetical protein HC776_01895 [bacterium]|nr:hypothetical protein [bacterium]
MELDLVSVDVGSVLQEAANTISAQVEAKGLYLRIQTTADLPHVTADLQRIRQILTNLLGNAVKFTREGGITLTTRLIEVAQNQVRGEDFDLPPTITDGQWVLVSVEDTGIGIRKEDQRIIFDAFRQANGQANREFEGTGLGLAIADRLIKMHQGYIHVASEPDKGSRFSVILPVPTAHATQEILLSPDDTCTLVIDADVQQSKLIRDILKEAGFPNHGVPGMDAAVRWVQEQRTGAVVINAMSADVRPVSLLQRFRDDEAARFIPVIILAAEMTLLEREQLRQMNTTLLVNRQLNSRDVVQAVTEAQARFALALNQSGAP